MIAISVGEYEVIRSDPRLFAVVDVHVAPDIEDVFRETNRFAIVRKHEGTPAEIVEEEDPRG